MAYSPDGKYLVFPEIVNKNVELVALRVKNYGATPVGNPISITKISGMGFPLWPKFDNTGEKISYHLTEHNDGIYLASLNLADKKIGENKIPIMQVKEETIYNACWFSENDRIAFLRLAQNYAGISIWNRRNREIENLQVPETFKTDLKVMPDEKSLSFITDGSLWKQPLTGGNPELIYPNKNVRKTYIIDSHEWGLSADTLYLIIANRENEEAATRLEKIIFSKQTKETLIDKLMVQRGSEIRRSPSGTMLIAGIWEDFASNTTAIQLIDLKTKLHRTLTRRIGYAWQGEITWCADEKAIIFGAYKNTLNFSYYYLSLSAEMTELSVSQMTMTVKNESRTGQISLEGKEMIMNASNEDTDIWILK